jgi:hypothetical protein
METTKTELSLDQLKSVLEKNLTPKTILRRNTFETVNTSRIPLKRSKTTGNLSLKKVVFADKCKKPLKEIFEVPYILYDEKESPRKKLKSKGCQCIIF